MRFAWVGVHAEGIPPFEAVLATGVPIQAVLTLRPDLAARRSGHADYRPLCQRRGVPLHYIANVNDAESLALLRDLAPDVAFVIGWHQLVREPALRLARVGMLAAHASLLPRYRGSAPINWALIRGERETGNSLVWLTGDPERSELVDQRVIPITPYDTCATLYAQVAATTREMLLRLLPRLLAGERPGTPLPPPTEPPMPRRRPADGLVDWTRSSREIYDFVRALTRPYPGAFSVLDGHRWLVWRAALPPPSAARTAPPGVIVGTVVSPVSEACGILVACGAGTLQLLEIEDEHGVILSGRALSEQPWTGRRWGVRD
ncbi:MAG TPA: formyltransferase family protein [Gemmatimonadales bacterium]|nr:formyltransferase family protein [Gemmatimonadales bacterium]